MFTKFIKLSKTLVKKTHQTLNFSKIHELLQMPSWQKSCPAYPKILLPVVSGIHMKIKNQQGRDSMFSEEYHLLKDFSDTASNQLLKPLQTPPPDHSMCTQSSASGSQSFSSH